MFRIASLFGVCLAFAAVACGSSSGDDINGSAECNEFCQRAQQCGGSCSAKSCAAHDGDLCTAGTLARLKCEAEKGSWQCINGGWAVAYSCSTEIAAACATADAGTDATSD